MAIIQCTKKLLRKLEFSDGNDNIAGAPQLNNRLFMEKWHANLLIIERRQTVLFTNDETLFSFIAPNLLKLDFLNLKRVFIDGLNSAINFVGLGKYAANITQQLDNNLHFTKSGSRSVLGSMNDMAFLVKAHIERRGGLQTLDLQELVRYLNQVPFKAIDFHTSTELFKAKLIEF